MQLHLNFGESSSPKLSLFFYFFSVERVEVLLQLNQQQRGKLNLSQWYQ